MPPAVTAPTSDLSGLFRQLWVFGDSLSDVGSRLSLVQALIDIGLTPGWSGVTYSNTRFNWQVGLRTALGLASDRITNPWVGLPFLAPPGGTSYAIAGATCGSFNYASLFRPQFPPGLFDLLAVDGTGIQGQISRALLVDGVRFGSNELVTLWGGSNDLLVALDTGVGPEETGRAVLAALRADLVALVRNGGARQVLAGALAPLQGSVDGVAYRMPAITRVIEQAQNAPPGSPLREWAQQLTNGGIDDFQQAFFGIVAEVQRLYPYANLMPFIPDYGAFRERFGDAFGSFARYGIRDTTSYAQASGTIPASAADVFLYLDDVHPTRSGQEMLSRGIELTLQAARDAIAASTLTVFQRGGFGADRLQGSAANDGISGGGGNDRLQGEAGNDELLGDWGNDRLLGGTGNDVLDGGLGSDVLSGGAGADFFRFSACDANGWDRDVITDFRPGEGDRLGIATVLGTTPLFGDSAWRLIGADAFSGSAGELRFSAGLLQGDGNGDRRADLAILLPGIRSFDTAWIS